MPLFAGLPRPYWSLHNLLRGAAKQLLPQGLLISAPWCHQPFGRLLLVVYKRQKAGMSPLVVAKKQDVILSKSIQGLVVLILSQHKVQGL